MANVNVTISMDKNLKTDLELFLAQLGLSLSGAVSLFAKQALREGRIPFDIALSEKEKLYLQIQAGQRQIDKGETVLADEVFARLEEKYGL